MSQTQAQGQAKTAPKKNVSVTDAVNHVRNFLHGYSQVDAEDKRGLAHLNKERVVLKRKLFDEKEGPVKTAALKTLLQWERSRKLIEVEHEYLLNEIELMELKEQVDTEVSGDHGLAEYVNKIGATGHFLTLYDRYYFKFHYDQGRDKNVYTVYIPRVIEPEEQLGKEAGRKLIQGFQLEKSDYPEEKIQVRRSQFVESEFNRYFQVIDA